MNALEQPAPKTLPGFEHISRSWDHRHQTWSARILPGEYYVTRGDEIISTVLGSCVSACFRDPVAGVGGMNHFMLPGEERSSASSEDDRLVTRYGLAAMENLVNDILKLDQFHISAFARMVEKMDSIKEANGTTLLDNTILTLGAGLGDGATHQYNDLPVILAGGGGGKLKLGRHFHLPRKTPIANLWLTHLQALGVKRKDYADSTGILSSILA